MKKFLFSFLFIVNLFQITKGQKWLWFEQGYNLNSSGYAKPQGICTDPMGNVYQVGDIRDTVAFGGFIITPRVVSTNYVEGVYIVKYNNSGNVLWALCGKSNGSATSRGISTDAIGNVYIAGSYAGILSFGNDTVTFTSQYPWEKSFFLAKFDPNGNIIWLRGTNNTQNSNNSYSIANDLSGNVYLAGTFQDTLFLDSQILINSGNSSNIFIAKFNSSGNIIWVRQARRTGSLSCLSIAADTSANIYLSGAFEDSIYCDSYQLFSGGQYKSNLYLIKYNTTGTVQWAKTASLSGSSSIHNSSESKIGITTDVNCNIYLTGDYVGNVTFDSYSLSNGTSPIGCAFICKYNSSGYVSWAKALTPVTIGVDDSQGHSVSVDKWGGIYWAGELSGASHIGNLTVGTQSYAKAFLIKLNSTGIPQCGSSIVTTSNNINALASDPLAPNVYFGSSGIYTIIFGNDTLKGPGSSRAFMTKWACDTCSINAFVSGDTSICSGESTTLTGTGGISYVWSNGLTNNQITIYPATTTQYTLYVSDGICSGQTDISVNVNESPTATISGNNNLCFGQTTTLTASGGDNYFWSTNDTTSTIIISPTSTDSLFLSVTNNNGCFDTSSFVITVTPYPMLSLLISDSIICSGNTITISASGGNEFLWNTGATTSIITVSPDSATIFYVTVTNNNLCSSDTSISLTVNQLPIINIVGSTEIFCGDPNYLSAYGGKYYQWSTGETTPTILTTLLSTTIYFLTVTDTNNCSLDTSLTVFVHPSPVISISNDTTIFIGDIISLSIYGGTNYLWSTGESQSKILVEPSITNLYCVTVTDSATNSCTNSACVNVIVEPYPCGNIFVPSIFSPNNDGNNDILFVRGNCITKLSFKIYNRWGQKIFETEDISNGWDGKFKGQALNLGVFVYSLRITREKGDIIQSTGNITLVK